MTVVAKTNAAAITIVLTIGASFLLFIGAPIGLARWVRGSLGILWRSLGKTRRPLGARCARAWTRSRSAGSTAKARHPKGGHNERGRPLPLLCRDRLRDVMHVPPRYSRFWIFWIF